MKMTGVLTRYALSAFLLLGFLAPLGCTSSGPPSVLIVVIDSLRKDHLGVYGYPRPTSPHIDAFANSAVVYENAYTTAPWTTPAVASLLTCQLSSALGIQDGNRVLDGEPQLLSEVLRAHDYATGAVVSHSLLGSKWGFDRGFERFEERIVPAHGSNSPEVTDAAIGMLDAFRDRPFFLFVHYFDVHFPYVEHPGFEMPGASDYAGKVRSGLPWTEARAMEPHLGEADRDELVRFYDSEIAYTDAEVGRLLAALAERGRAEETFVVITSDHGEEFLERGRLGHTLTLYDELVAIPLLARYPGGSPGVDARAVSLLDVYPAALEVAGVPAPPGIAGASLRAAAPSERPLRIETSRGASLRGVVSGRFKLILDRSAERLALYDRERDPGERENLADQREHTPTLRRLAPALEQWPEATPSSSPPSPLSELERQRLEALGYTDP